MTEETKRVEPTIGDTAAATATDATIVPKKQTPAELAAQQQGLIGATQETSTNTPVIKKQQPEQAPQDNGFDPNQLPSSASEKVLNQVWGIDPNMNALAPYVHGNGISTHNDIVKFRMKNGDNVDWSIKSRPDGTSYESISFDKGLFGMASFTQISADGIAAVALAKGWPSMAIQGNTLEQKEMLWLAGESKGLSIRNFQPLPDSPIWEKLKERNPERFEELTKSGSTEPIGVTNDIPASNSKFAAPKAADTAPAAPAAKPTFNEWLDTRAAEAKSPTEAEGFKIMSRAVKSGAVKLDEIDQKSIQTNYKPKVREGVMEADGKGYNRVVEIFKAKGVDAPQKVPEQEIIAAAPKVSAPAAPKA